MENNDFSFMKTGFNQLIEPQGLSKTEEANILSILQVYIEEAMKIAEGFVQYEGRTQITSSDVVLSLKAQALDHSQVWETNETRERIQGAYKDILQESNSDPVDSEGDSVDSEGDSVETPESVDTESVNMEEDAYQLMLTVDKRWENWCPTEFPYNMLKGAIDKTAQAFQ